MSSAGLKKPEKERSKESSNTYTTELLLSKLKEFFRHDNFKSNLQKDAIKAILKRKLHNIIKFLIFGLT